MRSEYKNKTQAYETGVMAETVTSVFMFLKGYRTVARRYKTGVGEIDLVLCKGRRLVFVEVKSRRSLAEAVTSLQARGRRRIEKTANHFVMENSQYKDFEMRFDLVCVVFHAGFPFVTIDHLDNAWMLGA